MGAIVSAIVAAQNDAEAKAKAHDALNALTTLAQSELNGFYDRVT